MARPEQGNYFREGITGGEIIYKFIPLKYVLTMLRTHRMRVSNIMEWEDVYENYFLKQTYYHNGIEGNAEQAKNNYFGMCWTTLPESDALWRIYSKSGSDFQGIENVAVRVQTTAQKLLYLLWGEFLASTAYVGKVDYMPKNRIITMLTTNVNIHSFGEVVMNSLFTKRTEFSHEKEVRIIVGVDSNVLTKYVPYFDMEFNPNSFFENNFMIDPRVTEVQEQDIRNRLIECGISNDQIVKSTLYTYIPINGGINI